MRKEVFADLSWTATGGSKEGEVGWRWLDQRRDRELRTTVAGWFEREVVVRKRKLDRRRKGKKKLVYQYRINILRTLFDV